MSEGTYKFTDEKGEFKLFVILYAVGLAALLKFPLKGFMAKVESIRYCLL